MPVPKSQAREHWIQSWDRGSTSPERSGGGQQQDRNRRQQRSAQASDIGPSRRWQRLRRTAERRQTLQIEGQIARRLKAQAGFFFQAMADDPLEAGGNLQAALAQLRRVFLQNGVHGF